MSKYTVTYFDIKGGLGEPIRLILAYMGKEFEDVRIKGEQWPELKKKVKFGKLPTLEIDGKVYSQSTAICRYLGNQAGLNGKNDLEKLDIDMIVGTYFDFSSEISSYYHQKDPEAKEEHKKKILNETLPFYFSIFEERVKTNGYMANKELSWADFFLVANLERMESVLETNITEKYPHLAALKDKVFNIPKVKAYLEKRSQ
ncbi:hypothetical protein O3M35_006977 [Rhynocoris fuscipes]|uniref:glutathione transferase n=1 Tax=Rhynocoris fuscipes TaxID=488301 RepID=A0AAW1DGS2_9HEMI